jgi:glutathione peroxidase
MTYGVSFPLMAKANVNGRLRHPLYAELTKTPDASGKAGRVKWNFEKFVIQPSGEVERFRPTTQPDAPEVVAAIERGLAERRAA